MKTKIPFITLMAIWLMSLLPGDIRAQASATDTSGTKSIYAITKTNGTTLIGEIISDDGREILLNTTNLGRVYIEKADIRLMEKIEDKKAIVNGDYQVTGPFTTRYAFTTNALPIVKGENYSMVNLFGPEVHFAVSSNLSVGLMTTWFASPLVLALKYSIKTRDPNVNFSIGTLIGTTGYINSFRGYGGLHWLSATFGNRKNNVTISAGYGYFQSGNFNADPDPGVYNNNIPVVTGRPSPLSHGPMLSFAGIFKLGARASFIFDSMFGFFDQTRTDITQQQLTAGSTSGNPYVYTPPTYRYIVESQHYTSKAMFLMPGIRFQKSEKKAFQISIAQVLVVNDHGQSSFPLPMCSWFRKF